MNLMGTLVNTIKTVKNAKKLPLHFQCADVNQFPHVLKLLRTTNTRREPFAKCVKWSLNNASCNITDYHLYNTMKSNLSVMAQNDNCEVVGVVLNSILKESQLRQNAFALSYVKRLKIGYNLEIINRHNENNKIFKTFGVDEVSDIRLIAVRCDYDYDLVAKQLINLTENKAKDLQLKVIKGDFSNKINKKLLRSCDFNPQNETPYWENPGPRAEFTPFFKLQMFYKLLK